jgi:hypothetical protein
MTREAPHDKGARPAGVDGLTAHRVAADGVGGDPEGLVGPTQSYLRNTTLTSAVK